MNEKNVFDGLVKLALEDLENIPKGEIKDISFCVYMTATRTDGSAVGGAFLVDPEIGEDTDSQDLVKNGSLPSLTSYILMRQSQPIVNRCITAAVTLQDLELKGTPPAPEQKLDD